MRGAEYLIKALEAQGVEVVFGYPGGAIMPVYDALVGAKLRHILVRHEQGAAIAADGYARASGKVGVCFATSGPGATNLVTGLANAYLDSIPLVAITGQVASNLIGTDAFQEVDVFGITMPVLKHNFLVRDLQDLPEVIQTAFKIAASGRPGPVLIDLPKDIANAEINEIPRASFFKELPSPVDKTALVKAQELLSKAQRPLAYIGGGVVLANAAQELRNFIQRTSIPVVSTLKALGSFPANEELFLGMLGMHGTKAANYAVQNCDLLLCIGARFDDRATGRLSGFAPNAQVIHMDIDASEVGKLRSVECALVGDIKDSLNSLSRKEEDENIAPWIEECKKNKKEFGFDYNFPHQKIFAPSLLHELSIACNQDKTQETFVSCDVGQHQMWVAQHYEFMDSNYHLTSGGLGTMGYGLPAAIGVQFAKPEARSIVVSGDGSIMMNIQELATIKRYKLPVKIILLDNQSLGMVRQWQELFFAKRFSEIDLSDNPDFLKLAEAFEIESHSFSRQEDIPAIVQMVLKHPGPLFIHVAIDKGTNVWPLVPPGAANHEMMEES